MKIILASKSPRRRELMSLLADNFITESPDVEENEDESLSPCDFVCSLAKQKADAVFEKNRDCLVIGSDTIVVLENKILGKPTDEEDACQMLRNLSGKTHEVYTGVCINCEKTSKTFFCKTDVTFFDLNNEEISEYVSSGEPMDKAGSYGIQGKGSLFVERINGDYFNVVGFAVSMIKKELDKILK